MLRTVQATRYVTPLREGGSLPAIVEADDLGLYVVKFRGAGQGPLALVAEILAAEIGRALALPVPELVLVNVDPALARNEPDAEIRDLLARSAGLNIALDYLPGSVMFDPAARHTADRELASRIVWFDAFCTNIDRTPRNPNLLRWHKRIYLIDHGAAFYFQHDWSSAERLAQSSFPAIKDHVLLPWASDVPNSSHHSRNILSRDLFEHVLNLVPREWMVATPDEYVTYLLARLTASDRFTEEAAQAHALFV